MAALADIKAQLARVDAAIDGIKGDIATIKDHLASHAGGMTADEVADLLSVAEALAAKAEALDAENPAPASEPAPEA